MILSSQVDYQSTVIGVEDVHKCNKNDDKSAKHNRTYYLRVKVLSFNLYIFKY